VRISYFSDSACLFRYEFRGDPNEIFSNFFKQFRGGGFDDDDMGGFSFGPGGAGMFAGGSPFGSGGRMGFGPMGGIGGMGGMGMPGMGGKRPFVADIKCTLEELYSGTTKRMKITRQCHTPGREREHVFEIQVKPGWKAGTKITFAGEGDEFAPGQFQDVVLVVKEKPHAVFRRDGHNLLFHARCSLADALCGFKVDVPTLDGRVLRVNIRDVVRPSYTKIVAGEGMPISKSGGTARGDLLITFDVDYPHTLPDAVKAQLRSVLAGV